MKKLATFILVVAFSFLSSGSFLQHKRKAFQQAAAYLIETDFEGTGTPTYWTVNSGSPDFDYTTTVIDGTQSALFSGSSNATASFTAGDERWGYFRFRIDSFSNFPFLLNDVAGFGFRVRILSTGKLRLYNDAGSELDTGALTLTVDTVYNFWWRAKKGTGANAEFDGWISTSTTKPGSADITSVAGDMTAQVSENNFDVNVSGSSLIIDSVLVSNESIEDNPWSL